MFRLWGQIAPPNDEPPDYLSRQLRTEVHPALRRRPHVDNRPIKHIISQIFKAQNHKLIPFP